ncbi:hydroxyethylthiazole kinase, partial [Bacillus sp. S34]|nr:hydroxyethylthiazole kinase [Bacillus sp. S34]
ASAAMVDVVTEAGPFARVADALLVNTGTPHAEPRAASLEAASAAVDAGTPWVLDPVAVGSLPVRTALARDLLALGPTVLRGNASEVLAVLGASAGGRGVDSTVSPDDAGAAAVAATAVHTIAAELAARDAGGPGTFQPLFLDRLASLSPEDVVREARITVEQAPETVGVPA